MSKSDLRTNTDRRETLAGIFAALGEPTRLGLVSILREDEGLTLTRLAQSSPLTRQGLTRHLQVLEDAGVVESTRSGRERHFRLAPGPFKEMQDYLRYVSQQWDDALNRLQAFVEE